MKNAVSKIFWTIVRVVCFSALATFILMSVAKCTVEVPDEAITIFSYSENNDNFKSHNSIPVKVIASNSNTDIDADIVYFPTDATYEAYKGNFNELESVRFCNVACLYIPNNFSHLDLDFNSIVKMIDEDVLSKDVLSDIKLKFDFSSKEEPAFLELLFNCFSNGSSYDELPEEERGNIISRMKSFISKNDQIETTTPIIFSINNGTKEEYYRKELSTSAVVSERLVAVTKHGEKYLEYVKEEYFIENGISNCKIISSLPGNVVNEFSDGNFDYEINTVHDRDGFFFYLIGFAAVIVFLMVFAAMVYIADEDSMWPFSFIVIFPIIVANLIWKSYFVNSVVTAIFVIVELRVAEFYDIGKEFEKLMAIKKEEKAKKVEELLKAKELAQKCGEENVGTYDRVLGKLDNMIDFCQILNVDAGVWQEVKSFIQNKPNSISIMKNIIDNNVNFMLEIYYQFSDIKEDDEKVLEVKETLDQLNDAVMEDFEDKKKLVYGDINACIRQVRLNLQSRIK